MRRIIILTSITILFVFTIFIVRRNEHLSRLKPINSVLNYYQIQSIGGQKYFGKMTCLSTNPCILGVKLTDNISYKLIGTTKVRVENIKENNNVSILGIKRLNLSPEVSINALGIKRLNPLPDSMPTIEVFKMEILSVDYLLASKIDALTRLIYIYDKPDSKF